MLSSLKKAKNSNLVNPSAKLKSKLSTQLSSSRSLSNRLSVNSSLPTKKSLFKFAFELSLNQDISSFLLTLRNQFPKKNQVGEIILFYQCKLLGLRRAYLKKNNFHEEMAQLKWSEIKSLRYSKNRENLWLAREIGRPISKSLVIPLSFRQALLFVELPSQLKSWLDFFEHRVSHLRMNFERVYESQYLNREAYFWTQLFSCWKEPMAVLKDFQVLKSNSSFKKVFLDQEEKLKKKKFSGSLKVKNKTYQLFYHPLKETQALFYAHDISKYFSLKEQWFQAEKMLDLFKLGQNMAHQLNNPLTGVRAMTQILNHSPKLKNFKKELWELEKAIHRSHQIIKSFLSFSEIGKDFKSCDLNQVIEDSLPLLKSMTKRIFLVKNLYQGELKVKGSFALFQQVTYNLILNACQALLEDEKNSNPELTILTDKLSGDFVRMRIIDNGKGIPQENLDKIFRPLWTSRKNGTGFGLGITEKIIKKYGGGISVSSQERKRTCFTVKLPLYCPETLLEIIDSA